MHHIAVIDFGSQYTHLLVRRLRDLGAPAYIYLPHELKVENKHLFAGIVLSGGPNSVTDANAPQVPEWLLKSELPILGLCYGFQYLAHYLGGRVEAQTQREYGLATLQVNEGSAPFNGLTKFQKVWMSHGDSVLNLPEEINITAYSEKNHCCLLLQKLLGTPVSS